MLMQLSTSQALWLHHCLSQKDSPCFLCNLVPLETDPNKLLQVLKQALPEMRQIIVQGIFVKMACIEAALSVKSRHA
jgi:hypothetical protein